jgi:hypothetical protein
MDDPILQRKTAKIGACIIFSFCMGLHREEMMLNEFAGTAKVLLGI